MTTGLTVTLHEGRVPDPPTGWAEFVTAHQLPAMWSWSIVHAVARTHRSAVVAAVVRDGTTVRGVMTARLTGLRTRRGAVPVAGIADVDCLASGSMPGLVLDERAGVDEYADAVRALCAELRREYGHRLHGVMFRQVSAHLLPAVLRSPLPSVVHEGMPIAVFHNTFTDFDGYLATLSRSRRSSLRRSIREATSGFDVEFRPSDAGWPPLTVSQVCELYDDVVHRNHHRWWLRKRLLAPEVARVQLDLPGLGWLCYRDRTGKPIAFATVWEHPSMPIGGAWGTQRGGQRDLWFHCHATFVRCCIESGYSGFVSGKGTLAEKIRLGFQPQRQWAVLVTHRR